MGNSISVAQTTASRITGASKQDQPSELIEDISAPQFPELSLIVPAEALETSTLQLSESLEIPAMELPEVVTEKN